MELSLDEDDTFTYLAQAMIGISVFVFFASLKLKAWYGRFYSNKSSGLSVSSRLGWFLQELPAFTVPALLYLSTLLAGRSISIANQILLGLFLLHYFQRVFIFPYFMKGNKQTPVSLCCLAATFCAYNGFLQGAQLVAGVQHSNDWLLDARFLIGVVAFFSGMLINIHSDHILRNLRKDGSTDYQIPRGGLFEYVSVANYFGEILEWSGFALAGWSLPSFAFAVFTMSFLVPRAVQYHGWYQEKFKEDYPTARKAVIPFLI